MYVIRGRHGALRKTLLAVSKNLMIKLRVEDEQASFSSRVRHCGVPQEHSLVVVAQRGIYWSSKSIQPTNSCNCAQSTNVLHKPCIVAPTDPESVYPEHRLCLSLEGRCHRVLFLPRNVLMTAIIMSSPWRTCLSGPARLDKANLGLGPLHRLRSIEAADSYRVIGLLKEGCANSARPGLETGGWFLPF